MYCGFDYVGACTVDINMPVVVNKMIPYTGAEVGVVVCYIVMPINVQVTANFVIGLPI